MSALEEEDLKSSENNEEELHSEEEYTVIRETVKKRPVRLRKILLACVGVIAGAILFGITGAYVFSRFLPVFGVNVGSTVQFAPDPTPTPAQGSDYVPEITEEPVSPEPAPENDVSISPSPSVPEVQIPEVIPEPGSEHKEEPDPAAESEERIRQNRLLYSDLRRISSVPARAVVTVTGITEEEDWFRDTEEERHQTSGVIVADNGLSYLILTQYTALEGSSRMLATLFDSTMVDCSLIKKDDRTGLAIVAFSKYSIESSTRSELQIASLGNSYNAGIGEPVIAIGAPLGYSGAVVFGQITSVSNKVSVRDAAYALIMTNIQGAPGGSGILINLDGEVIGIIAQQYASGTGGTITALPVSPLKKVIEILSNNQKFAYLGITGEDVTGELAESFGMPVGIFITDVDPDSPAFAAGIQRGDILCRVGGTDVTEMTALGNLLNDGMAGTAQVITVQRLGADGYVEIDLTAEIGEV